MKMLLVVDVQDDFVNGSLGTAEAVEMLPRLVEKAKHFNGVVYMTQDTHGIDYLNTQEGKILPVEHCIEGTPGWELVPAVDEIRVARNAKVYRKNTFGSWNLAVDIRNMYENGEISSLEIVGICTDICVVSNALLIKAAVPELPISVDASCCAGVTPEKHHAALDVMASCQISILESH